MSKILDLLADIPTNAVLRERIVFIREQAEALEKQIAQCEQENTGLKKRVAQLENALAAVAKADEFVECRGALFKRKPTGGYDLAVYCPSCRGPMISIRGITPFVCTKDSTSVNFTGNSLSAVMRELPE